MVQPQAVELANLTSPTLAEVIAQATWDRAGPRDSAPACSFLRHTGLSVA